MGVRENEELVRAAMRDYRLHLSVKCSACGAEPGRRCRRLGYDRTTVTELDAPHATRRKAAEEAAQ